MLASIREAYTRLEARPDSEHEQAAIRVVIGLLAFIYLVVAFLQDGSLAAGEARSLRLGAGFLIFSALLFSAVARSARSFWGRRGRRLLGQTSHPVEYGHLTTSINLRTGLPAGTASDRTRCVVCGSVTHWCRWCTRRWLGYACRKLYGGEITV